ncbi:MAG: 50S ribosomal protein L21, partial [Pseudonocardiales bacterium]
MYAIVKTGGRQYRVAVGDELEIGNLDDEPGAEVSLAAILLVDGDTVTADAATLAKASVTAEVVGHARGPKIRIHKFKSKTGYHKR